MLVILVAGILGLITAAPTPETCPMIMKAGGITEAFVPLVTHGIHSITVEDIRYYFEKNATEENNIPTVNMDTASEERVLLHAPLAGYDDTFSTHAMKMFDSVLRNMDRPHWGIPNFSVLEKVDHVIHMAEIWQNSVEQYRMVEKLLDPESDLCACVSDIENNGILQYLHLLAFKIRYPGIATGNDTLTAQYLSTREKRSVAEDVAFSVPYYRYPTSAFFHKALTDFDFDKTDLELLKDVATKLIDGDGVMSVHIDSPEHWEYWKNLGGAAMEPEEADFYNIAVFLFCMLN